MLIILSFLEEMKSEWVIGEYRDERNPFAVNVREHHVRCKNYMKTRFQGKPSERLTLRVSK